MFSALKVLPSFPWEVRLSQALMQRSAEEFCFNAELTNGLSVLEINKTLSCGHIHRSGRKAVARSGIQPKECGRDLTIQALGGRYILRQSLV